MNVFASGDTSTQAHSNKFPEELHKPAVHFPPRKNVMVCDREMEERIEIAKKKVVKERAHYKQWKKKQITQHRLIKPTI